MTEFKRFEEAAWAEFGGGLLVSRGAEPEEQKNFLRACLSGKGDFLGYIDKHLGEKIVGEKTITFEYKFSASEFLSPPKSTQKIIWDAFRDMPEEVKCCHGFWGYVVRCMIEKDQITPDCLASQSNGTTKTGKYVVDVALKDASSEEETEDGEKVHRTKADRCVRRVLRSMCNPEPRGKRVVFDDFPLGKAYWRWHWADRMHSHIGLDFEETLKIFDEGYYGAFAAKMHTSKSYIGSPNTLGGLLLFLKGQKGSKKGGEITGKKLKVVIDKIGYLSAWKAIEQQDPSLTLKEIREIEKTIKKDTPKSKKTAE